MNNIDTRSPFFPGGKNTLSETKDSKGIGGAQSPYSNNSTLNPNVANDARVSIPDGVRDFSRIKKAVDAAPEIDNSDKIARLKAQIQAGNYEVDYDALADKMLASEF